MPVSSVCLERDFIRNADLSENAKLRRALANANALLAEQGRAGAELRRQLKTKDATISELTARIATLEGQVTDLISALKAKDPTTSSTPPSCVQPHQRKYPTKTPSGKAAGRAKGAPGKAPQWSAEPDEVVNHRPTRCPNGHLLDPNGEATLREARQVREIEMIIKIIEHRLLDVECAECAAKSHTEFPLSVRTRISWGPSVRSFALLLSQRAFLPTQASVDTLAALGINLSKGCLDQWRRALAHILSDQFMPRLRTVLLSRDWLGLDETPVNVSGMSSAYVHVATDGKLVSYHLGSRSLDSSKVGGIVGVFGGTAVTDCAPAYFSDDAGIGSHQLCCAHLVRELKWADEVYRPSVSMDGNVNGVPHPQPWAAELVGVLQKAMAGKADYDTTLVSYTALVEVGLAGLSPPTKDTYRRERDTWNLLVRLRDHQDEVLGFMTQEARSVGQPPTNNSAEQAVKPHKVRQRRSGCFRSIAGAREYLVVQSYLRSAVLSGVDPLEAITRALAGDPWLPDLG